MGFTVWFILCIGVVLLAVWLGAWGVRVLGNAAASKCVIATWSVTTSFVIALFVFVASKDSVYEFFCYRSGLYESSMQAADTGLMVYAGVIVVCAVVLCYIYLSEGFARRSATIRRRRNKAQVERHINR